VIAGSSALEPPRVDLFLPGKIFHPPLFRFFSLLGVFCVFQYRFPRLFSLAVVDGLTRCFYTFDFLNLFLTRRKSLLQVLLLRPAVPLHSSFARFHGFLKMRPPTPLHNPCQQVAQSTHTPTFGPPFCRSILDDPLELLETSPHDDIPSADTESTRPPPFLVSGY